MMRDFGITSTTTLALGMTVYMLGEYLQFKQRARPYMYHLLIHRA